VPIRHAVKPSFEGFDHGSAGVFARQSFRATPHTLGGWRHSAVSESGTGLGVTQAVGERYGAMPGYVKGAHMLPPGAARGRKRGGGKGI